MADESVQILIDAVDNATATINKVNTSLGGVTKTSDATAKSTSKLGGELGNLARSALGPITQFASLAGAGIAVIKVLKDSINAAAESEAVMARLSATLAATGRGAEISAGEIEQLAANLSGMTAFDDEAIINAYNALMKFDSIPTNKMSEVVTIAADMAAAMGTDVAQAAEMVGRILETGTIPRTLAFSSALKEQIQEQIKAGDTGAALSTVMTELSNRYGGQAIAQLNTYKGSMQALKNELENVKEELGAALLPAMKDLAQTTTQLIFIVRNWDEYLNKTREDAIKGADGYVSYNEMLAATKILATDVSAANYEQAETQEELNEIQQQAVLNEAELNAQKIKAAQVMEIWRQQSERAYQSAVQSAQGAIEQARAHKELATSVRVAAENMGVFSDSVIFTAKGAMPETIAMIEEMTRAVKELSNAHLAEIDAILNISQTQADYNETIQTLFDERSQLLQDLAAAEAQYGADSEQALDIKNALDKNTKDISDAQAKVEESTNMMVLDLIKAKLMADGVFSEVDMSTWTQAALDMGLITQDAITKYNDIMTKADEAAKPRPPITQDFHTLYMNKGDPTAIKAAEGKIPDSKSKHTTEFYPAGDMVLYRWVMQTTGATITGGGNTGVPVPPPTPTPGGGGVQLPIPEAGGGYVSPGQSAWVGDAPGGRMTPYTELLTWEGGRVHVTPRNRIGGRVAGGSYATGGILPTGNNDELAMAINNMVSSLPVILSAAIQAGAAQQ